MENLKKILFILILFFLCTLLFSACDTSPEQEIQKKQNIVITKKIIPPKQQKKSPKPSQPAQLTTNQVAEKPVVVIDKKPEKPIINTANAQNNKNITKESSTNSKINKAKGVLLDTKPSPPLKETKIAPAATSTATSHIQPKTVSAKANTTANNNVINTKSTSIALIKDSKKKNNILKNTSSAGNLVEEIHDVDKIPYYIAKNKIDPFLSPIKKIIVKKRKRKQNRKKLTPLEKLDLSQLKLVAIIRMQTKKKTFAMVQESNGKGYMVKVGTYIGTNNGRIVEIKDNGINIKEEIENFDGTTENKITKMKLQKKNNG